MYYLQLVILAIDLLEVPYTSSDCILLAYEAFINDPQLSSKYLLVRSCLYPDFKNASSSGFFFNIAATLSFLCNVSNCSLLLLWPSSEFLKLSFYNRLLAGLEMPVWYSITKSNSASLSAYLACCLVSLYFIMKYLKLW
jgi:hypothetical protein